MDEFASNPPRNGQGDRAAKLVVEAAAHRQSSRTRIEQREARTSALRKPMSLPEMLLRQQLRKRPDGREVRQAISDR